ncbi:hypothetical protein B0H15DRAFT_580092 [Mycena belliarum]|uniref:F-box domain-containing protein n=1 Tax=Mycena belliarum TaxID=1033014 RepID=A0AAD6UBW0_9AGAR|nr:hypothetical protein B0H15DRAFT_580092 [Mycena belliae]
MDIHAEPNQAVIFSVPTEILLEIVSYFYDTPIPYERYRRANRGAEELSTGRFEILRALSLTCRRLRSVFQALVWAHLEALPAPFDGTRRHVSLFKKRMTGILKTPSLPRGVRSILVSLDLSTPNWNLFTLFVRFLQATPNLAALHIVDISDRHAGVLSERLEPHTFPSVTALTIPSSLSRAVASFPALRVLICADSFVSEYDAKVLLRDTSAACPLLECLANLTPSAPVLKSIVTRFPGIQTLRFRHPLKSDALALLQPLHKLQSLEFPFQQQRRGESLERVCDAARALFLTHGHAPMLVEQSAPVADIGDVMIKVSRAVRESM